MAALNTLRDWLGRVVKRGQLAEPQTARAASLRREFADHPVRGLTPGRLAAILQDAEQGQLVAQADLGEEMEEKDAHIHAELGKRKRALLGLEWSIEPPRNPSAAEQKAAEQLDEWVRDMDDLEDHLFDLADAIGKGYSNLEIEWQRQERFLLPRLSHRPARWFTVAPEAQDTLLLRSDDGLGDPLWPMGWISHVHKAKSGYVARSGLHRVLAWPFLFKNYSVRDLAEFLEIYGLPVRIGTYPGGASEEEKSTLLRAVLSIGHNAAGIMPEGMHLDFQEAAKGASDPYQAMIDWCERSQSKAILGGTLTSQADGKSSTNALGNVHNEVRHDLLVSDARQIAGTLTRDLIWPMVALNLPGIAPGRAPRFVFQTREAEDLVALSDALPKLVGIGMRIPLSWAHDKLQIPEADEKEPVLGVSAPSAPLAPARVAAAKATTATPDLVDRYGEQLQSRGGPIIDDALEQVRALLDQVDSLEELQHRLVEAFDYLDTDALAELMQQALAAAELAGRFEVAGE